MTTTQMKKVKPSTKAHEVYDSARKCVVMVGSRQACNVYWLSHRDMQVRPVTDTRF